MLFPTVAFALFFCVAFLTNWLVRPRPLLWRMAMIGLSLFFYGYWDRRFVLLLVGAIAVTHLTARRVHAHRHLDGGPGSRWPLVVGVAANLGVLGFFKYYGFFVTSAEQALGRVGLAVSPPLLDVTLPIGISFFTFQAISYLVDLHRGRFDKPMTATEVAVFLSFFPQLVAGPIVRATDMVDQIRNRPDAGSVPAGEAFSLIIAGLVKKVVISSYLATNLVDPVFAVPGDYSRSEVLLAVYGYAIQIYADFSGYTDIAIGCALLLGFRFRPNFDAPYRALSVQEFWRRWHISLSTWLRDYLYVPLGGNRRGRLITYRNIAITMVLGGLWHGAAWPFVVWGAIHAVVMIVEREVRSLWRPLGLPAGLVVVLRWTMTFHVVCLAWVFFRAGSFSQAVDVLERIVSGGSPAPIVSWLMVAIITAAIAAQFLPPGAIATARRPFLSAGPTLQIAGLALALTVIDALGPEGVAPFIYFQF